MPETERVPTPAYRTPQERKKKDTCTIGVGKENPALSTPATVHQLRLKEEGPWRASGGQAGTVLLLKEKSRLSGEYVMRERGENGVSVRFFKKDPQPPRPRSRLPLVAAERKNAKKATSASIHVH